MADEESSSNNGVAVLGDTDLVLGMKLAGATKCLVYNSDSAKQQVEELKGFDIIIVTEDIAIELNEKGLVEELGTIVQVPDKFGSKGNAIKQVSQLFEDALGLKIEE